MANEDIRDAMYVNRLKHYQVAEAIGVSTCHFSRMLQRELTEEKKKQILETIDKIK